MTNGALPAVHLAGSSLVRAGVVPLLERLEVSGRACMISAGWQESEGTLHSSTRGIRDLELHRRAEALFSHHPTLRAEHSERQRQLMRHQSAYSQRLAHAVAALDAVRHSHARSGSDDEIWRQHESDAMNAIRVLDRQHLRNTARVREAFFQRWNGEIHPGLAAERDALAALIGECDIVLIAGGHIAVLLNRMRLFDVAPLVAGKRIVAWGAGAMALAEQIVLYDDRSPQGPRVAEVLEDGLGIVARTVLFPNAVRRLDLGDTGTLRTLAARAAPRRCITLGDQALATFDQDGRLTGQHAHSITPQGRLRRLAR